MKEKFWLFGTYLTIVTDEVESSGRYDLIEGTLPAGIETPLHVHTKYTESIYVLAGELTVYIGNRTEVLKPGASIFIPMGVAHVVASSPAMDAKALTIASPSGFAELIRLVGISDEINGAATMPNDMSLFLKVSEKNGDIIVGPPGSRPNKSE